MDEQTPSIDEALRKYSVMAQIAKKSYLKFICVCCDMGFSNPTRLYKHIGEQSDELHQGLNRRDKYNLFIASYKEAMGWSDASYKDSPKGFQESSTRPQYSAFFEVEFVVSKKGPSKYNTLDESCAILERIIGNTKKEFVCPQCSCLLRNNDSVSSHFLGKQDEVHQGLRGKNGVERFLYYFFQVLGRTLSRDTLPLGESRGGPTSFYKCFRVSLIVEWKLREFALDR
jgi:hypothetical protein